MNEVSRELFPGEAGYVDEHEPDDLDEAVGYLETLEGEDFKDTVENDWSDAKPLFSFVNPESAGRSDVWSKNYTTIDQRCGCLTMIASNPEHAAFCAPETVDVELTAAIKADDRLPGDVADIGHQHLPVFAEWQRFIRRRYATAQD